MNGRYALAQSPEERLAVVMVAAIHSYFVRNPHGVMPGQGFIMDFIKPFVERELTEARMAELHGGLKPTAARELELAQSLKRILMECEKQLGHKPVDGGNSGI